VKGRTEGGAGRTPKTASGQGGGCWSAGQQCMRHQGQGGQGGLGWGRGSKAANPGHTHTPFTITLRQSQVVGSVPLGCAIPTPPLWPRYASAPQSATFHRLAPQIAWGPGILPTTTGTCMDPTMGNIRTSFALDSLVLPSTPLSQIRWHQPSVPPCNHPISLTYPINC